MPRFRVRPSAWNEISDEIDFLEGEAGIETANRMLTSLINSFALLAESPEIGMRCGFTKQATRRLRRWPVKGFENWLIFYQPSANGVEIVHVMHGAQDIASLLDN